MAGRLSKENRTKAIDFVRRGLREGKKYREIAEAMNAAGLINGLGTPGWKAVNVAGLVKNWKLRPMGAPRGRAVKTTKAKPRTIVVNFAQTPAATKARHDFDTALGILTDPKLTEKSKLSVLTTYFEEATSCQ